MKPLRLSRGVVPIAKFKSEAPRWFKQIADSGEPVVITLNGKPAGVLLSPSEFDRLQERERFLASIAEGVADANSGRVMTSAELRKRLGGRRP
ncbi:MAG: type II toxin-antitoxin system Phd/YefM family antitoxin [Deltaproteobacteria bacterium]|nr:type II toxin-antitoxin system Phd/YefM family antitoxin [Deltaproteobacteria bacterium]